MKNLQFYKTVKKTYNGYETDAELSTQITMSGCRRGVHGKKESSPTYNEYVVLLKGNIINSFESETPGLCSIRQEMLLKEKRSCQKKADNFIKTGGGESVIGVGEDRHLCGFVMFNKPEGLINYLLNKTITNLDTFFTSEYNLSSPLFVFANTTRYSIHQVNGANISTRIENIFFCYFSP